MRAALAGLITLLVLAGGGAEARAPAWTEHQGVSFRLIAATASVGPTRDLLVGLQVRLLPGWKFFWRAPGPSGIAPRFDGSGSTNVKAMTVLWPAPRRLDAAPALGDGIVGYEREVVLPILVVPARPGAAVALRLAIDYAVCGPVCIPDHTDLALDLPAGTGARGPEGSQIDRHLARVPKAAPPSAIRARRDGAALVVEVSGAAALRRPDLFVDAGPAVPFGAPVVTLGADRRSALFRLAPSRAAAGALPARITVTLVDGARAIEGTVPIRP
ncbi:MAG: hypothetical protein HY521_09960 [Proteobacteria bacterium]|nr:hypothetical protein [Pseudomonadota bacterium]